MAEELLVVFVRYAALFMLGIAVALIIVRWKFPPKEDRNGARVSRWREIREAWLEHRALTREKKNNLGALRSKNVLVVDPDEKSSRVLAWQLKGLGCSVTTAKSGTQGLNHARKSRPSFVIIDALLPDISAVDFYRALGFSDVPVVFIGVLRDQWDDIRALGSNVACFAKPYNPEETLIQAGQMLRRNS